MNKSRSRAYNRDVSKRKALRKKRLAEEVYYNGKECPYYNNLHQYSKNKIHCSCPMCSPKTRNKGRRNRKNYQRALNKKPYSTHIRDVCNGKRKTAFGYIWKWEE